MLYFLIFSFIFVCQALQAQAIKIKKPINSPELASATSSAPQAPIPIPIPTQIETPELTYKQMEEICNKAGPLLLEELERISKTGKLTQVQRDNLNKAISENKPAAVRTFLSGKIDPRIEIKLKSIVPEYAQVSSEKKEEIFRGPVLITQNYFVEKLFRVDGIFGGLSGDQYSFGVAQLSAKLLSNKKIKVGDMIIEDIHLKLEAGYPKNGLILVSGKITEPQSNFSFEGSLGSLSYDQAKEIFEVNAAEGQLRYSILPWLSGYAGTKLGYRSYRSGGLIYIDPSYGVEAKLKGDRLEAKAYVEGQYRPVENNAVLNCGTSVEIQFLENDLIKMNAAIISRYSVESNPQIKGNSVETFNGVGITGIFGH